MKKRIICLLLVCFLMVSCLAACGGEAAPEEPSSEPENSTLVEDKFVVKDGRTDYVLILPTKPMEYEKFAAEEFTAFMQQATGCEFRTVSDTDVSGTGKYISIGNTQQLKTAFPEQDLSTLNDKQSSYFIATKDENIYVASGNGFKGAASLYAIYDILHDMIGYTYYADTEIYVEQSTDVNLRNYEEQTVAPSFDMRTLSTAYIYSNNLHNNRLRYVNFSNGTEWNRITNGHSQLEDFLHPTDTDGNGVSYGQSHPEWFVNPYETTISKSTNQLCWTAGGSADSLKEMQTVVANKMITYLQMDPEANFFMFGQHDNADACTCAGCQAALKDWAGTASGLQIGFFNGVLEQVEAWREANMPEREVFYVVYAYLFTQAPPVSKDADGNYVPFSDKVIPNSKMRIFYAPVRANYAFAFNSPVNKECEADLQGWKVICTSGQLFTYLYDLNIYYYFINFFNFGTVQSMYQELKNFGVTYLLTQGASDQVNVPGFQELRAYVTSNIMWDVNRNYQTLAADFITHYYKDAAENMQEVFDMLCDQNTYYVDAIDPGTGTIQAFPNLNKLYPRAFVEKLDEQMQQAFAAIEHYKDNDPELYETLKTRIMKEYLCVIYLKATVYGDDYSAEEMSEMRGIWKEYIAYFNITNGGEGQLLPEF